MPISSPFPLTLTLRNYRCFEESRALELEIGPGFTAIVGPNNCGKSSFLRCFYELRAVLASLATEQLVNYANKKSAVDATILGVLSPSDLKCDRVGPDSVASVEFRWAEGSDEVRLGMTSGSGSPWQVGMTSRRDAGAWKGGNDVSTSRGVFTIGGLPMIDVSAVTGAALALSRSFYFGPFRNTVNVGKGDYFDIKIGSEFVARWKDWKTGADRRHNQIIEDVTEDLRRIFSFDRLEINAADQLNTLQVSIDRKTYKLQELGAGLAQFILVMGTAAISRPTFILIDEPELNLHPSLQVDFLTSLASYASVGVIFATHQLGLARVVSDRIYSFSRDSRKRVQCSLLEQTPNYAEFLGEMSFGSYQALGFDRVLLVEGVTEVKVIQQLLRLFGKEHQVVLLPLGGSQMINGKVEFELAELKRISPRISVLVDSERTAKTAVVAPDRLAFKAACEKLGFSVHITDRRATENYFSDQAVKSEKGLKYSALGEFDLLKTSATPWSKGENWKIARRMTLAEVEATDLGHFLAKL